MPMEKKDILLWCKVSLDLGDNGYSLQILYIYIYKEKKRKKEI